MRLLSDAYLDFVVLVGYLIDELKINNIAEADKIRETLDSYWITMTDVERVLARKFANKEFEIIDPDHSSYY